MGRKRKELPILQDLEITSVGAEGNAIARHNEKVVFIPYGAPGDVANVKIDKKKHSFCQGHIIELKLPSPLRIEPKCSHFETCGGCKWQHLPYDYQLDFKRQQVIDNLSRIAKVPFPEVKPCIGSSYQWEYRNKVEYTYSNKKWLTLEQLQSNQVFEDRDGAGFHIAGTFDKVLDIEHCYLHDNFGNNLRDFIKNFVKNNSWDFYDLKSHQGFIRTLMVRSFSTGDKLVVVALGEDDKDKINILMEAINMAFPNITSLNYVINLKMNDSFTDLDVITWKGKNYAEEKLGDLIFRISPKSFYQTNSIQAHKLYETVRKMAALTREETVYDLYTGTGTIANYIARDCKEVIGIEYVEDAIEDAWLNAKVNGIENTRFYAGDMKDVLNNDFIVTNGQPDVLIVDPPRAGMHPDVIKVILEAIPDRIVYVSCNPSTQARDVAMLHEKYDIIEVQPVDMFPHTHHIENVICLKKRKIEE